MTADHENAGGEDGNRPIVYDPSAWTGSGADQVDPLTRKEYCQSRALAAGRVFLHGGIFCIGSFAVLQIALQAGRKLLRLAGSTPTGGGVFDFEFFIVLIAATILLLSAFYTLRWLLRELVLPAIRGGFTGKPCVLISDDGFIDKRILRDFVPWEDVESIRFESNSKIPDAVVIALNRSHWRRDTFLGKALSSRIVIWEGLLAKELYKVLRAHFRHWRSKDAKAMKPAGDIPPPLSSPDRDPAAPRRDSE